MRIAEKVRRENPMMNVRIDPCNQSGETIMGRRSGMLVGPVRGSGRKPREDYGRPSRFRSQFPDASAGSSARVPARTDEVSVVRSPDGGRARRKQKPRSCDESQDGAAIAEIRLPFMSKQKGRISR